MNQIRIQKVYLLFIIGILISGCSEGQTKKPTAKETIKNTKTLYLNNTILKTMDPTFTKEAIKIKSIIGEWERHGKMKERHYTEHMIVNENGKYTIEAIYDESGEILASTNGTFTFNDTSISFLDKDNKFSKSTYYLDETRDILVINNQVDLAWKRIK
jgi:predicted Zn-dependent peptidase